MFTDAIITSLSFLRWAMPLQPYEPLAHEICHRNNLGQEAISGDDHDCGHNACAEKDILHLFSTIKSFHKYYFKLILTCDPRRYQDLGRSSRHKGVLAAPSPPGPSVTPSYEDRIFFFKLGKNMNKSEVWN